MTPTSEAIAAVAVGFLALIGTTVTGIFSVRAARGAQKASNIVTGNGHGTVTEIAERTEVKVDALADQLSQQITSSHRQWALAADRMGTAEDTLDHHTATIHKIDTDLHSLRAEIERLRKLWSG